ncbi:MAG: nuclear transport factor 2 family protein [Halioglobus sp.]|nr:nuclear transport factor 2 family protein [Halioglobus sp.]
MTTRTLEQRISDLEDLSAIEQLRHRYWLALMDKKVDELLDCFAEDARLEYGFGIVLEGKAAIDEFFQGLLKAPDLIRQVPRGANRQITLIDPETAKGRWLVEVVVVRESQEKGTRIGVQYFEDYRKVAGHWRIATMKNDYLSFESVELKDGP